MQELFFYNASSVQSERILYTPSSFARGALLHLQEVGSLKALHPHTSMRADLVSYLCFLVLAGEGHLMYEGKQYPLKPIVCLLTAERRIATAHRIIYGHLIGAIFMHHFYRQSMKNIRNVGDFRFFIRRILLHFKQFWSSCINWRHPPTIYGTCVSMRA